MLRRLFYVLPIAAILYGCAGKNQQVQELMNKGKAADSLKKYDEVIADYSKAIELAPNDASLFYGRGMSKYNSGKFYESKLDFDKAVEMHMNTT